MDAVKDYNKSMSPFQKQLLGTISTGLIVTANGACIGYSAVLLPQLKLTPNFKDLSTEMESWIAAIMSLAVIIGTTIAGAVTAWCGRKLSHQIIAVPMTLGWLLIGVSTNIFVLLSGRFLTGLAMGLHTPVASVYIAELSSPKYREFFLAFISLTLMLGVGLSHLLGTYLHWQLAAFLIMMLPFFSGVLFLFLPDTPSWLVSKDRYEDARSAFRWYRGHSGEKPEEVERMIKKQVEDSSEHSTLPEYLATIFRSVREPQFWKPFCILLTFFAMIQFSVSTIIAQFAVEIFGSVLNGTVDSYTLMLTLDGIKFISSIVGCYTLKYVKRRTSSLACGVIVSLSIAGIAAYVYLRDEKIIAELAFIPIVLLVLYFVTFSAGVNPMPFSLMGELYPIKTRGIGITISSISSSIFMFVSSKTAQATFQAFTVAGAFLFYSLLTLFGTTILMFILPETKGKTLQEIEEEYSRRKPLIEIN